MIARIRRVAALVAPLALVVAAVAGRTGATDPAQVPPPPRAVEIEPPWELPGEMLVSLARQADLYRDYALRFTCTEDSRVAHYDESAEATSEKTRRYDYLLERDTSGVDLKEYREVIKKRSKNEDAPRTTGKEADDEDRFPPAYAWVFLFSQFHQPYFMYRDLGDRFEGFNWVHEIQFRGALPFTDGKDIREWEGTVLVDVVTHTPIEIRAEPATQKDRIRAVFDHWSRAFNLIGIHLAPRPFGYRCRVLFGLRRDRLSFPTELRYDTFRATGPKQFVPWMASVRVYDGYRFFKTSTSETTGVPVSK